MIRCSGYFVRNLCSSAGISPTMQKFFRQSIVWAKPQSLAAVGLSSRFPNGSHSFPAPTARTVRHDNRCQPTSTARAILAMLVKATWLHHALGCRRGERKLALATPRYLPRCDACVLSRSWLCRSLLAPFFGCLDALAVQNHGAGLRHASGFKAHFIAQSIVQLFQRAVTPPAPVARMHRAPMGKLTRQHSPLAAGAQNVENRIHDPTALNLSRTAKALFDKRTNALPLRIAQIG